MSFKKTKIFVAVAIVVFIFAVGNIVLFGNLSKEKVVVINNQTNLMRFAANATIFCKNAGLAGVPVGMCG